MAQHDRQLNVRQPIRVALHADQAPGSRPRGGSSSAHVRLYCLAHAGGTAGIFHSWRKLLPPEVEICPIEYPGHGSRLGEPLLDSIEQVARTVADAITAGPSVPYALLGHSMGSLVAFEACYELAARRAAMPRLLVVCGHRAPGAARTTPQMHNAPHAEFIAYLRELGATPPEVFSSPDLLDLVLPILRTDFRACETYRPQGRVRLPINIAAYGGLGDADAGRDELLAWQYETAGECVVRMFPAGHFFVSDCADRVLAMLERDLSEAFPAERAIAAR
jgi:surfactin synthase thioesterase subunit